MRVLFIGYYGRVNLGDEAILSSLIEALGRTGVRRQEVTVASFNPDDTIRRHRTRAIQIKNPVAVLMEVLLATHVVFGGGGYHLRGFPLLYEFVIAATAHVFRKRLIVAFVGVEPIRAGLTRRLAAWLFSLADWVAVRDVASLDELRNAGLHRTVLVAADPVLAMDRTALPSWPDAPVYTRPYVVFSLVTARNAPKYRKIARIYPKLVDSVIDLLDVDIVLVSTSDGEGDIDAAECVARESNRRDRVHVYPWPPSLFALADVLRNAQMVVGMRYHVILLSALLGAPCAVISRSPKVTSIAEDARLLVIGDLNSSLEQLLAGIKTCWDSRDVSSRRVAESIPHIKQRYLNGVREFLRLFSEGE